MTPPPISTEVLGKRWQRDDIINLNKSLFQIIPLSPHPLSFFPIVHFPPFSIQKTGDFSKKG